MTGVSIMMPAYNGGDFVIEAAAGALEQMSEQDELLIQDGGSKDGSVERLRAEFGHYPQLKLISERDGGQADALNQALARAANPVVGWLNADDRIYPGAIDAVRAAWDRQPGVDVIYGTWSIFNNAGETMRAVVPKPFTLSSLMWSVHMFSGSTFFRRDLLAESGGFDADLYMCMDLDVLLRLAARGSTSVQLPEMLAGFRWHDDSKTGATDFRVVSEAARCRRRHASGFAGKVQADGCSAVHLVAWCATPLRRAEWYSRWRLSRAAAAGKVELPSR